MNNFSGHGPGEPLAEEDGELRLGHRPLNRAGFEPHRVCRMTAAIGHPTLRLVRWSLGAWPLDSLPPGAWRAIPAWDAHAIVARIEVARFVWTVPRDC